MRSDAELPRPAISVILATYHPRLDLLHWTLEALKRQTINRAEFEVVIVDNGSNPPLEAAAFWCDGSPALRMIREARSGLVHARIAGAAEARAAVMVFVDDDNALDADYLAQALRIAAEEPSIGCFGGIARPVFEGRQPAPWK
ncbi:MAG: glycosyltransferase family A protein, partial [Bryobacteraceae bacterium]